jgi:hypothetical protein
MAPPLQSFPLNELPSRTHEYSHKYKTKIRKPQIDFETCDLYELVQYSCVNRETLPSAGIGKKLECWPFVRLFRRCGQGEKMFTVETTAWEGEHAFMDRDQAGSKVVEEQSRDKNIDTKQEKADMFAEYGKYFWSKK